MTFDAVADELYSLPPGDFVAARNARAREMTTGGNKADATAVRKLARPAPSAWLVNCLVREDRKVIDTLLSLGSKFQEAQRAAARDRLRALTVERQSLIETLVAQARDIATRAGQEMTPAVQRDLEGTLEAAVADEDAARSVREGRLVRALSHVGFGGLDLASMSGQPRSRTTSDRRLRAAAATPSTRHHEQEREKRKAALQQAEAKLNEVRRHHRTAEGEKRKAEGILARADGELRRAADALERAAEAYDKAKERLKDA